MFGKEHYKKAIQLRRFTATHMMVLVRLYAYSEGKFFVLFL